MYELLGYTPKEREDNRDLNLDNQKVKGSASIAEIIDTVETKAEAEKIRLAGGFIKNDQWYVVTGYREKVGA